MDTKPKKSRLRVQIINFPVKMMEIPVNMMKLPVNAMISGMNTITESMQEIQKKSQICRESEDSEETDEGRRSAFRKASRSAMMPYLEMLKLPRSVLLSSLKSISETVQELRDRTASGNGARSGEGGENGAWEPVALTSEEAALESEAVLTEDSARIPRTILWQIGRPGRSDFEGKWTEVFDYEVGTDLDAIHSPAIPHFITVKDGLKSRGATEMLNIHFVIERDYPEGELAFSYDRWGAEKDRVEVDGNLLAAIRGAGKGKFREVALSLPALFTGEHVIAITTSGETESRGHRVDHFAIAAITKLAEGAEIK